MPRLLHYHTLPFISSLCTYITLYYHYYIINYYVVYVFINYNSCCHLSRDVYRQLRCTDHDDDGAASPPCKKFQLEADLRLELKTGSENHMDITWMTGALPSSGTPKVLLNQGKQEYIMCASLNVEVFSTS